MSRFAVLVANLINMHAFIQINQSQAPTSAAGGISSFEQRGQVIDFPLLIISTPPFTLHLVVYKFQLLSSEPTHMYVYNHPHRQASLFGDFINVRLTIMSPVQGSPPFLVSAN